MPNVKIDLKVVLLGKEYGGKTSLVERFIYDRFTSYISYQNTIGAAYVAKKVEVDGQVINMGIWDTAGSERYEAMSRIYYRNAKAAIICYDLTDAHSFERAKFWVSELKKCEEECRLYLCGTKYDLIQHDKTKRAVDYHTITDFADEIKAFYIETSSKTSHGVSELFTQIGRDYVMSLPATSDGHNSVQTEEAGLGKFTVDVGPVLRKTRLKCCSS